MHHVRIKNKAMYLHKNWQNLKGPIMGPRDLFVGLLLKVLV